MPCKLTSRHILLAYIMREPKRPSDDELEEAFSTALSRPNPFFEATKKALEAEDDLNECLEDIDLTSDEVDACIEDITEELNEECEHLDEDIEISGNIKRRIINHRLIQRGEPIPESAVTNSRENVTNLKARSLGYTALLDGTLERPAKIYHVARSNDLDVIAFDARFGAVYLRDRLLIPIDGSAHVELSGKTEPNWGLLDYYIEDELLEKIDSIYDYDNLSASLQALGKINLNPFKTIVESKSDPEIRRALVDYVNHGLEITYKNNVIYQISGANTVFIKDVKEKWITQNLPASSVMFGSIESVVIDQKVGKFHLLTRMPFEDNSRRLVIYKLSDKLSLTELPTFAHPTPNAPKSLS